MSEVTRQASLHPIRAGTQQWALRQVLPSLAVVEANPSLAFTASLLLGGMVSRKPGPPGSHADFMTVP